MKNELLSHLIQNPEAVESILHVVTRAIESHESSTFADAQTSQDTSSMQDRRQLLEALKPHLSKAACDKIDHAVQLCALAQDVKASLIPATDN